MIWEKYPGSGPRALRWSKSVPGLYAHYFGSGVYVDEWSWEVRWDVPGLRVFTIAYGTASNDGECRDLCKYWVGMVLAPMPPEVLRN